MRKRAVVALGLVGIFVVALGGFGIWIGSLPPGAAPSPEPIPATETAATLEALRPSKRERPVIAVIGINDATETLDYLMPAGILRRADVAEVLLVATEAGPVKLYPALSVEPDITVAAFDAAYPEGADYVIVPAMSRDDDPAVMAFLQEQAGKGSIIVAVCAGAKVAAAAGLLDAHRGTTHWFYLKELLRENPTISYVANRRFLVDQGIATTTGISASMPMALTLIEAIAGRAKAEAVAAEIGVDWWDARHDSNAFRLTRPFVLAVAGNVLQFWQREEFELGLQPGFDAVSLALVADAWSRTYRSRAFTSGTSAAAIADRDGILILPDRIVAGDTSGHSIATPGLMKPAVALDQALDGIATRYGDATANAVAMQLEYPASTQ